MSVTIKNIIPAAYAPNSQTTVYTATGVRCIIDKFTISNPTGGAQTLAVNLVASGDSASAANKVLPAVSVAAGAVYKCPELVGQSLEAGGFISVIASASSSLVISASGREIS